MSTPSSLAYLVTRSLLAAAFTVTDVRAGRRTSVVVAAGIASDVCAALLVLAFYQPQWRATLGTAVVPILLYAATFEIGLLVRRFDELESEGEVPGEEFSYISTMGRGALAFWEIFAVVPPLFMGALLWSTA